MNSTPEKRAVSWLAKHPGEIDLFCFSTWEMDEMNGMEAATDIRKFNQDLMIVFVTGYTDYVFDGYKVGALDYIIAGGRGQSAGTDGKSTQHDC